MLQKIANQLANTHSPQNGLPDLTAMQSGDSSTAVLERYFTVWVLLCVVIGVTLGQVLPNVFPAA